MEKERKRAVEMGYPSPIQPDKESTDRDYDIALDYILKPIDDEELIEAVYRAKGSINQKNALKKNLQLMKFKKLELLEDFFRSLLI